MRIDPSRFDKITERENKSFVILKNQIDNYTLNYDDYFGLGTLFRRIFVKKNKGADASKNEEEKSKIK